MNKRLGKAEPTRAEFEEAVFREYYIRGIRKTDGGLRSTVTLDKAELLERQDDGYRRKEIDAMWFGWCLRLKSE